LGIKAERYVHGLDGIETILKGVVDSLRTVTFISSFKQTWGFEPSDSLSSYGTTLIDRMSEGGKSVDEVVWTIIPTAANAVASQGQSVRFIYFAYFPCITMATYSYVVLVIVILITDV